MRVPGRPSVGVIWMVGAELGVPDRPTGAGVAGPARTSRSLGSRRQAETARTKTTAASTHDPAAAVSEGGCPTTGSGRGLRPSSRLPMTLQDRTVLAWLSSYATPLLPIRGADRRPCAAGIHLNARP